MDEQQGSQQQQTATRKRRGRPVGSTNKSTSANATPNITQASGLADKASEGTSTATPTTRRSRSRGNAQARSRPRGSSATNGIQQGLSESEKLRLMGQHVTTGLELKRAGVTNEQLRSLNNI